MKKQFHPGKQAVTALTFLLLTGLFCIITPATSIWADTMTGYSTAEDLNLRKEASTQSKSLAKLKAGDSMEILGEAGNWYQVQYKEKTGYVNKLYVNKEWIAFSNTSNLNLRKKPSASSKVLDQLNQGDSMIVLGKEGKWYKVQYNKKTGYVKKDYIEFQYNVYVDGSKVNLRKKASTDSKVLTTLNTGGMVTLLSTKGNWYQIRYNKKVGYIRDVYISFTRPVTKATGISDASSGSSGSSSLGQSVVNYAKQFLGNPYVYGGTSLTNGADCSGFVQSVFAHFGISLPRTSEAQRSVGTKVNSLSEAKPGDLICYYGHVGIYIGNNAIIHASNEKTGIKITYNAGYRTIASIRRVI